MLKNLLKALDGDGDLPGFAHCQQKSIWRMRKEEYEY